MIEIILCLVCFDIILTHYQFSLDKKFNVYDKRKELNLLPRLLIGNNPSPLKAIFHSIINMIIFYGLYILLYMYNVNEARAFIYVSIGALFLINYIHLNNIVIYYKNRDNDKFWEYTRLRRDVIK
jgi:hypothetical protein